jgi:tRNA pseudouridine38-40 synthase
MRYFIELSYKGTHFHGWQMQGNAYTVQAELNRALALIFRCSVSTYGCGRTDTGVHARQFFAHFDSPDPVEDPAALVRKLNCITLPDMCIHRVFEVANDANVRFDAVERTYKYFMTTRKNPYTQEFAWLYPYPLNVRKMNMAARLLLEVTEFGSFMKANSDAKSTTCRLKHAHFEVKRKENLIVFTITSNRFLRNMVRAIVGTLIDVGCGKLSALDMRPLAASQSRSSAGASAPAQGLFLWEVKYPYVKNEETKKLMLF